jgi:hypothetical protein
MKPRRTVVLSCWRDCHAFVGAACGDFRSSGADCSHDLGLSKQQIGLVFETFGLSYPLFEVPMGCWHSAGRAARTGAECSGMVSI